MMSKKRFNDRSKGPKHLASVSVGVAINKQGRGRYCELPEGFILTSKDGEWKSRHGGI
jgi:hypothetical protein